MHRRWLTAIGGGTVLLVIGLTIATVASGVADLVFLIVLALWTLGGLGWVVAGEGWAVADLQWYQHVGVGVALVAAGMAALAAQTLLVGDRVVGGMQGLVAVILLIQAVNHYRGGNITEIVEV
jgi:hypothetical protein